MHHTMTTPPDDSQTPQCDALATLLEKPINYACGDFESLARSLETSLAAERRRVTAAEVVPGESLVDQKLFIERMAALFGQELQDWRCADQAARGVIVERDQLRADLASLREDGRRLASELEWYKKQAAKLL